MLRLPSAQEEKDKLVSAIKKKHCVRLIFVDAQKERYNIIIYIYIYIYIYNIKSNLFCYKKQESCSF